jgi:alpha-galactosidase
MPKITFMGAGSTIFAKSILGDSLLAPALCESEIALYDIDAQRREDSRMMMENLNANINDGRASISAHLAQVRQFKVDAASTSLFEAF